METSQRWIDALGELRAARRPCVMVVVTDVRGSAPREAGARMLVGAGGELVHGTIGGGKLEQLALEHAGQLLETEAAGASESVDYPLGEKAGQCCGGAVTLFFEPFRWHRRTLAVFGAGHVAQAVGKLAPWLDARVLLIDPRDEAEIQPPVPAERPFELVSVDAPEGEVDELDERTLVLIMTHSHALDQTVLERALRRRTFPYVGLIGSERKWKRFQARLTNRGFTAEDLARVTCPIGVQRGSKEPTAIAISVAAQLLAVWDAEPATAGKG